MSDKHLGVCSLELRLENAGNKDIMERETCDGKASSRCFRNHLQSCVTHDAFELCLDSPSF